MIIAQITDLHIKPPGRLAYRKVDTAQYLQRAVDYLNQLDPRPDVVVMTGDLVDAGSAVEYGRLREILTSLTIPFLLIPGNPDSRDPLRAAFPGHTWMKGHDGFIQYVVDDYPVRLIGLDTTEPERIGGILCETRLRWLDEQLTQSDKPSVLFMHHPPFATATAYHDADRLENREGFAAVIGRHPHVKWVLCGHVHRGITVYWQGVPMSAISSTAHQLVLNLGQPSDLMFAMEPPACQLLVSSPEGMIAHVCPIGTFDGPYPIFEPDGRLVA